MVIGGELLAVLVQPHPGESLGKNESRLIQAHGGSVTTFDSSERKSSRSKPRLLPRSTRFCEVGQRWI